MLRLSVLLTVLALLAVPFVASAQGRGKVRNQNGESSCTPEQAAAVARARAAGREVPDGLDKKNCEATPPPPPPAEEPPTGIHAARGVVYEDIDGNGQQDMFASELGLAGWTVELYWNGRMIASKTTGADGSFVFPSLGNSTWTVCVIGQSGYNRTQPASGNACGGAGYEFSFASPFGTEFAAMFGFQLQ